MNPRPSLLILIASFFHTLSVFSQQWVHIPDSNFRAALLDPMNLQPWSDLSPHFSGDSLDVSSITVQEISEINVWNKDISDLTGVTHFSGLNELWCGFNNLQSLPELPVTLLVLKCPENQLASLPSLPSSLDELNFHGNQVVTLPSLPPSLQELGCVNNELHFLPPLPPTLTMLNCAQNNLQVLPALPDSLTQLYVQDNLLQCLPDLPSGLEWLNISGNNISCIPNAPPNVNPNLFNGIPLCNGTNINDCGNLTRVTGKVYFDVNGDCASDSAEIGLGGRIVSSSSGSFGITDNVGNFSLFVDSGTHVINQSLPNNQLWSFNCPILPYQISATPQLDSIPNIDFPNQANEICPWLTVSISTGAQRPCFDNNTYHLSFCNDGSDLALNAYIEVDFSPDITPLTSSLPWIDLGNNIIRFELGDVGIGECGSLSITNFVDCNAQIGQTVCATATIFPISPCLEPDPSWDGSSIEVSAECVGGNNEFTITNVGTGDMSSPSYYRIYQANAIYTNETSFQLNAGQSLNVSVPADGHTYRLYADQVSGHAGTSAPQAWLEGCGSPVQLSNIGFSQDDQNDHVDVDCTELTAAYDPNDKTVVPSGYGAENNITMTDSVFEYRIRFQNTGSDTAFNIVVVDTLSLQELDITTFVSGASSHPYWVDIYGGGVVSWHFDNIQLPDSNVNEPLSHGFVTFKINRYSDLPEGTVINNSAAIYFDYNAPIFTNTSFVTLSDDVLLVSVDDPEFNLGVQPNPVQGVTRVLFDEVSQGTLVVKDSQGRTVMTRPVTGTAHTLDLSQLESGIYIISLEDEERPLGAAKVSVLR